MVPVVPVGHWWEISPPPEPRNQSDKEFPFAWDQCASREVGPGVSKLRMSLASWDTLVILHAKPGWMGPEAAPRCPGRSSCLASSPEPLWKCSFATQSCAPGCDSRGIRSLLHLPLHSESRR